MGMTLDSKLELTGKAFTGMILGSIMPFIIFIILANSFSIFFSIMKNGFAGRIYE